ncbi:MAG: sulfotransferase family protein [Pseudorhodoplanes sp.]
MPKIAGLVDAAIFAKSKLLPKRKSRQRTLRLPDVVYNDHPAIRDFVFICGLHRSGTTLLERLLTSRYALSYLRASVSESEGQHMQSVYSPAKTFGGPGRFAFSHDMRRELAGLDDPDRCREGILNDWRRFVVGTSSTLIEKSPPNVTKIWWLRQVFPGSRFVILTRDPRAVATATQKMGKWNKPSLPELMMHWNAAYSQAMADFAENDCVITRYEDLVESPDRELTRIAEAIGLQTDGTHGALDERFVQLLNSNDKYIEAHQGTVYGAGIWQRFGYEV